ncbi:MAG TPA: YceI family protein [Bacteroidetes bacterium]|nr:YceI family protein [Bacteroidota bacterium]
MKFLSITLIIVIQFLVGINDHSLNSQPNNSANLEEISTTNTHIKFFSTTPIEDIEANNYDASGIINKSTGRVAFSVPMQSFQFEKSLMQRHFNQGRFLDTKNHPTAQLIGEITNLEEIDFEKDGTYTAKVSGKLTIRGVTNDFTNWGKITISGNTLSVDSEFNVLLEEFGIAFKRGKPSTNVAKTILVTLKAEFDN